MQVDITTSNTLALVMEEAEMHVDVSHNLSLTGTAGFVHNALDSNLLRKLMQENINR
jgi:hypothetical protein